MLEEMESGNHRVRHERRRTRPNLNAAVRNGRLPRSARGGQFGRNDRQDRYSMITALQRNTIALETTSQHEARACTGACGLSRLERRGLETCPPTGSRPKRIFGLDRSGATRILCRSSWSNRRQCCVRGNDGWSRNSSVFRPYLPLLCLAVHIGTTNSEIESGSSSPRSD